MNICKECRYFNNIFGGQYICGRPISRKIDPVTGTTYYTNTRLARAERENSWFSDRCGPEGKYFEGTL